MSENLGTRVLGLSLAMRTWKSSLTFAYQIPFRFIFKRVVQHLYNLFLSLKKCSLFFVEPQLFLEKQIALTLFSTPFKNQLDLLEGLPSRENKVIQAYHLINFQDRRKKIFLFGKKGERKRKKSIAY